MSKHATLLLIAVLAVSTYVMVGSVFAQSTAKPSVPEFTLRIVGEPYDVPTTYSINPYNGETTTHEGYHDENMSVEVSIKNQQFSSHVDNISYQVHLYYNIRAKGHSEQIWSNVSRNFAASDSEYTYRYDTSWYSRTQLDILNNVSTDGKVDYQVQAVTGHFELHYYPDAPWWAGGYQVFVVDESSGWSNTQTITIPAPTPSPPPLTTTRSLALVNTIAGVAIIAVVIGAGLCLRISFKKGKIMSILLITLIAIVATLSLGYCMISQSEPSVPEFTLQLFDDYVQVTIEEQPIIDNGDATANIFYNVRIKDHDEANWHEITVPNPSRGIRGYIGQTGDTGFTILEQPIRIMKEYLLGKNESVQVDFQIEAINGYLDTTVTGDTPPTSVDPNSCPVIIVHRSGWSNTQTVAIP